jgi:hypothetical protein
VENGECDCPLSVTMELWDTVAQQTIWQQTVSAQSSGRLGFTIKLDPAEPCDRPALRLRAASDGAPLFWLDAAGHRVGDFLPLTSLTVVNAP